MYIQFNCKKKTSLIQMCFVLVAILGFLVGLLGFAMPVFAADMPPVAPEVLQTLTDAKQARVIVVLDTPTSRGGIWAQSLQIAKTQNTVLKNVATDDFALVHRYQMVSGLVGIVTAEGLDVLKRDPNVRAVALDMPIYAATTESAALIRADQARVDFGVTGRGVNVAVIDSGIDPSHPDLVDNIVAQHCFAQGGCPPDNLDEGDSATDSNGHGTRVAGIISGRGATSPLGIAPDAGIVAVRVMDDQGVGWNSDVVAAIDWVLTNQWQFDVEIINLSLGGGLYSGVCDQADANTMLAANAIHAARDAGIAVFAAAGNGGDANAMTSPACISGAIAVGSVYDADIGPRNWGFCRDAATLADGVSCFSNSGETLDVLAPGAWIESTALGGGQQGDAGTSMAAPHAAAVAALMLQANAILSPDEIASTLKTTGVPVMDPRNGYTVPRIDALAAVRAVAPPPTPFPTPVPASLVISGSVTLQGREMYSDTLVTLSAMPCYEQTVMANSAPTNAVQTHTNAYGTFVFDVNTALDYSCLHATHKGYLEGQIPLSNVTYDFNLVAGDITQDNQIDIFDLVRAASVFGTSDMQADLNVDGKVNILDLVIIAGNYGKQGPTTVAQ